MEEQASSRRLRTWLRAHATTMIVSAAVGGLVAAAPTIAATVSNAVNADKVDGIHARSYTSSKSKRKSKLIAANSSGYLPNNIIQKADDANKIDGIDSASLVQRSHVIHVTAGSSSTGNGSSLLSALTSAGAAASATQPYLVQLEPGTYDVDASEVALPQYVHLAGSGMTATTITGTGHLYHGDSEYRVMALSHASEVRDLKVNITGGTNGDGTRRSAIHSDGSGATLLRVEAIASGAIYTETGPTAIRAGVYAEGAGLTIIDSDLYAKDGYYNYALWVDNNPTPVTVHRTTITSKGGGVTYWGVFASNDGAVQIDGSTIDGTNADLFASFSAIHVLNSILVNASAGGAGMFKCVNSYDENLASIDSTCGSNPL